VARCAGRVRPRDGVLSAACLFTQQCAGEKRKFYTAMMKMRRMSPAYQFNSLSPVPVYQRGQRAGWWVVAAKTPYARRCHAEVTREAQRAGSGGPCGGAKRWQPAAQAGAKRERKE